MRVVGLGSLGKGVSGVSKEVDGGMVEEREGASISHNRTVNKLRGLRLVTTAQQGGDRAILHTMPCILGRDVYLFLFTTP